MDKSGLLKRYFGHREFRQGQEALIDALLAGRDVMGVMPTGAGKSICYQLTALLLPGLTLVVSPLISLMKDQVSALSQAGVASAFINSSLSSGQCREVLRRAQNGAYKIIYVAPERLESNEFQSFARQSKISLFAVDEAHCVSQWGQDFRPSYLKIAAFVASLEERPVVGAFTATATPTVKADIVKLLALQSPLSVTTGFDRPNLYFEVARPKSKASYLRSFIAERTEQSGIVYCATRKKVEAVYAELVRCGVSATRYHAGLEADERKRNQESFVFDRAKVMVATNAFGMGIDKSNVSFVVHYNMPKNIESYYQEAGRAGRDGAKAYCVLLYSAGDIQTAKFLINSAEENADLSHEEQLQIKKRELERLEQMAAYCKTSKCLRAYLLSYFGESGVAQCGNCGNCNSEMTAQDITVEAQKILSAVARIRRKYSFGIGLTLVVRMLHGSKEQRILELGLDKLPTYGAMRTIDRAEIRAYIDCLIEQGCLELTQGEYPVLQLCERANQVLFHGEKVVCVSRAQQREEKSHSPSKGASAPHQEADGDLFAALRALRAKLAQEANVPAYIVFSNATLADMASKQPGNIEEFLQVSGVGEVKAARYGKVFLEEIAGWGKRG